MVLASFAGDSLALGVHWIYDTISLAHEYGRVEAFMSPGLDSYHPTKDKGDFTHYGDQMFVLLESVGARGKFDEIDFFKRWKDLFCDYSGYMDHATQDTLQNIAAGKGPENSGSFSNDFSGAARISPLILCYRDDVEKLIHAARMQTAMTHGDPSTIDSAAFFAAVTFKILHGSNPTDAMQATAFERFADSKIALWVNQGIESSDMDTVQAISRFGQSCATPEAFPGLVHLVSKYENNLKEGLIQSVMAGGDNAARSMMTGMVLGACSSAGALPEEWTKDLRRETEIHQLINNIVSKAK